MCKWGQGAQRRAYLHATAGSFIGGNASVPYTIPSRSSGLCKRRSRRIRLHGIGRHACVRGEGGESSVKSYTGNFGDAEMRPS